MRAIVRCELVATVALGLGRGVQGFRIGNFAAWRLRSGFGPRGCRGASSKQRRTAGTVACVVLEDYIMTWNIFRTFAGSIGGEMA